jgi:hypothetical protein
MSSEEQKTEDPTTVAPEEPQVVFDEEASSEEIKEEVNDETKKTHMKVAADAPWKDRMWEVFSTFWPLGFIAFGGPQVSCV